MVNEKTQIAGTRNVLAAVRPCCVQVIKESVAAAVDNWNDQHTTGLDTQSQEPCERRFSHIWGASLSYASTSWSATGMFELTSYYDACWLRVTAKSAG
jgi:hypothetical protein